MDAGVKIYEYTPGFVHSKQVLADDEMAVVGSINFDYRSLVHHYENAVWMYRTPALKKIREDFDHIFEVSQEITEDTFRFTWHQSLIKEIMQLFAPML
jgi:lipid phosphotransferase